MGIEVDFSLQPPIRPNDERDMRLWRQFFDAIKETFRGDPVVRELSSGDLHFAVGYGESDKDRDDVDVICMRLPADGVNISLYSKMYEGVSLYMDLVLQIAQHYFGDRAAIGYS
eukprot:tig00020723_g13511.t1